MSEPLIAIGPPDRQIICGCGDRRRCGRACDRKGQAEWLCVGRVAHGLHAGWVIPPTLFLKNVIAIVWDFDETLIPGYMQEPLFRRYGGDARAFFGEDAGTSRTTTEAALGKPFAGWLPVMRILTYVRHGRVRWSQQCKPSRARRGADVLSGDSRGL